MVGGAGAIQATPSLISFGAVGVNTVSNPVTVTITNPWTTTTMEGLTLTFPAGFQAASGTNTCTTSLGPGASCTVGVVFAPTGAGAQSGSLTMTSSTASASGSVALSGTGFDFSVAVSGSNAQTVTAGQIAYYTIAIYPLTGSPGGTFTFACGTLPTNALCIFDPAGEIVAAGGTGYVTVEISTGQSTTSSLTAEFAQWSRPFFCLRANPAPHGLNVSMEAAAEDYAPTTIAHDRAAGDFLWGHLQLREFAGWLRRRWWRGRIARGSGLTPPGTYTIS